MYSEDVAVEQGPGLRNVGTNTSAKGNVRACACVYQCANPHSTHCIGTSRGACGWSEGAELQLLHVEVEASKRPGAHQKIFIATIASSRQIGH